MKRKYVKSFSFGDGSDPCWLYFHHDNRYQSPDNPWYMIHNWSRMELLTFVLFDNPWKMRFSSALSLTYLWSRKTRCVARWQHWNGTWTGPRRQALPPYPRTFLFQDIGLEDFLRAAFHFFLSWGFFILGTLLLGSYCSRLRLWERHKVLRKTVKFMQGFMDLE